MGHAAIHHYDSGAWRSRKEGGPQPLPREGVQLERFLLEVSPAAEMDAQVDHFGNPTWLVSVEAPHSELRVTARSQVSIVPRDGVAGAALPWDQETLNRNPAVEFRLPSPRIPDLAALKPLAREVGLRYAYWHSLQRP